MTTPSQPAASAAVWALRRLVKYLLRNDRTSETKIFRIRALGTGHVRELMGWGNTFISGSGGHGLNIIAVGGEERDLHADGGWLEISRLGGFWQVGE